MAEPFVTGKFLKGEDTNMVFMIFALMDKEQYKSFLAKEPAMVFEYLDKASPRSCNGLPIFFSAQVLNREETDVVIETIKRLKGAQESALNPN